MNTREPLDLYFHEVWNTNMNPFQTNHIANVFISFYIPNSANERVSQEACHSISTCTHAQIKWIGPKISYRSAFKLTMQSKHINFGTNIAFSEAENKAKEAEQKFWHVVHHMRKTFWNGITGKWNKTLRTLGTSTIFLQCSHANTFLGVFLLQWTSWDVAARIFENSRPLEKYQKRTGEYSQGIHWRLLKFKLINIFNWI